MRSKTGKLFYCLVALLLAIHPIVPIAGAVQECTDHPCCCRDNTVMSHRGPAPEVYSAPAGCCSEASRVPCNLNEDYGRLSPVFTVSRNRNDVPHETVRILSADAVSSFHKAFGEFISTGESLPPPDPVPIYLHNLVLIC